MIVCDLSWLENHYHPAVELVPAQYRGYTLKMLDESIPRMDPSIMKTIDFSQPTD